MSSSNLSVYSFGVQGFSQLATAASLAAEQQTAALAATQPTILAASSAPVVGQTGPTKRDQYYKAQADKACLVDKDPRACSYWSQMLASSTVARNCGVVTPLAYNARRADSLSFHMRFPTWTSPVNTSDKNISSVGIAVTAARVPQPLV